MRYRDLKYCLLVASIAATLALSGCSEEEEFYTLPQTEEHTTDQTKLILSLNTASANSRSMATEMEGKAEESTYSSLTLYITDVNDNIETAIPFTTTANEKRLIVVLDDLGIELNTPKHIYLIANAKEELNGKMGEALGSISNISEITADGGFLMTGQAESENNKEITFTKGSFISANVELTRVVSKVLLTTEIENGFVKNVEDGFIKQENLRYTLQTTNSKFYYLPKAANNEDPNYAMNELIAKTGSSFEYINGKGDDFLNKTPWKTNGNDGAAVTPYNINRMENGSTNPYTEGVYCLENTTSPINFEMNNAEKISAPKMVTTYLRIAAKIIPDKINGTTYADAVSAERVLAGNNGTFYTYLNARDEDKRMCYSSIEEARNILRNKGYIDLTADSFKEHTNGWEYFDVYVNGKTFDAGKSGLIRNNYYISNITKIVAPLVEQTIEISTTVRAWVNKGTTHVDIPVTN